MTAPITVLFASSFGAGPALAALAWSSMSVSLFFVDLFGTAFVPRVNGRTMLWVSLTIFGVGALISAGAPTLSIMIAARVLQGTGAALFMGGGLQLAIRLAPVGGAGKAIGKFNAACMAGIATGPLLGGGLAELGPGQTGFRVAFLVDGAICLVVAVLARAILPSLPSEARPRVGLPRRPAARWGVRIWPVITLAAFSEGMRGALEFTALPLFGKHHLGMGTAGIGVALSALSCVDIATMRFSGALADRLGRRSVLCGALLIGATACMAAPFVHGLVAFSIWCAVLGIPLGALYVVPAAMAVDVSVETESAIASYRISADVGEAVGSTATGALIGAGGLVGAALALGAVFAGIAGWVSRLGETEARPDAAPAEAGRDGPRDWDAAGAIAVSVDTLVGDGACGCGV
jgi:predicted MFS family arabinose efflux permease